MSFGEVLQAIAEFYQTGFAKDNWLLASLIMSGIVCVVLMVIEGIIIFRIMKHRRNDINDQLTGISAMLQAKQIENDALSDKVDKLTDSLQKLQEFAQKQQLLDGAKNPPANIGNALYKFINKDKK